MVCNIQMIGALPQLLGPRWRGAREILHPIGEQAAPDSQLVLPQF